MEFTRWSVLLSPIRGLVQEHRPGPKARALGLHCTPSSQNRARWGPRTCAASRLHQLRNRSRLPKTVWVFQLSKNVAY